MSDLERIHVSSRYLGTLLRRRPDYAEWLVTRKNLSRRYPLTGLYNDLQQTARGAETFRELMLAFREFKQRHFLRIGGRDILGLADLAETTAQVSDLACVAMQVGLDVLSAHPEWWMPEEPPERWREVRREFPLTVMGLGKLGGNELNYVSDIDLLFFYVPPKGEEEQAGEGVLFLTRLCQWLSKLLADSVEGDRVFLVDLRLRPLGQDGPLVPPLAAAADHYLQNGRPWERQALLKARPVAGDRSFGSAFLQEIRPFVFRRFLDFQALDELRIMRDRILAEAVRPSARWKQFDVKLGVGGIREVEFLVQSMQLVYGGRRPELEESNTLRCIDRLREVDLLPNGVASELREAYIFLRRVEHWVQLDQNRQTQKLPASEEALERLSLSLGFGGDGKAFLSRLQDICGMVNGHFRALFGAAGKDAEAVRNGEAEPAPAVDAIGDDPMARFPEAVLERLTQHLQPFPPRVKKTVTEALTDFAALPDEGLREKVAIRIERYFGQVARRPGLVKVFGTSASWFPDFLSGIARAELLAVLMGHNPGLVEGISTFSDLCPDAVTWNAACTRLLDKTRDYEGSIEWIRRLKNERTLQVVLADLGGLLDFEGVERELTELADFVLNRTFERVRDNLGLPDDLPLAAVGLGKHGSREMSYLSDLDLVFVYDPKPGESADQIPQDVIRFVQRFMRMLSTPLQEGPGYAVDARLRPTGNYGPLIVTRNAWLDYYSKDADLWEMQALLRMRPVGGDAALGRWLREQADAICYRERKPDAVWGRICHLRKRMQLERAEERADQIDLKLGFGALSDVEFLVQGHQLIEGVKKPSLRNGSVRRALGDIAEDLAGSVANAGDLSYGYETLKALDHRLRLHVNSTAARMTEAQFEAMKALDLWPPAGSGNAIESWADILRVRRRVRELLQNFCTEL